jgi:hypothetical protein
MVEYEKSGTDPAGSDMVEWEPWCHGGSITDTSICPSWGHSRPDRGLWPEPPAKPTFINLSPRLILVQPRQGTCGKTPRNRSLPSKPRAFPIYVTSVSPLLPHATWPAPANLAVPRRWWETRRDVLASDADVCVSQKLAASLCM